MMWTVLSEFCGKRRCCRASMHVQRGRPWGHPPQRAFRASSFQHSSKLLFSHSLPSAAARSAISNHTGAFFITEMLDLPGSVTPRSASQFCGRSGDVDGVVGVLDDVHVRCCRAHRCHVSARTALGSAHEACLQGLVLPAGSKEFGQRCFVVQSWAFSKRCRANQSSAITACNQQSAIFLAHRLSHSCGVHEL